MSFQIERGLFKFDFTDHHAVLGIPVNADVKEVRKRYLKIARSLHPDSRKSESEAEKKLANQLLSKLVNPAYEHLSQGNRDYLVSLGHMGRRLAAEKGKVAPTSEAAKQLSRSGPNLDNAYKSALQHLTAKQYEALDQISGSDFTSVLKDAKTKLLKEIEIERSQTDDSATQMLCHPTAQKINFWYSLTQEEREIFYNQLLERVVLLDGEVTEVLLKV